MKCITADRRRGAAGRALCVVLAVAAALLVARPARAADAAAPQPAAPARVDSWVASWQASPQPVWGSEFLFPGRIPRALDDQTVRQTVRLSLGGPRLRLVFSNAHGREPVRIGRATVARAAEPSADGRTVDGTMRDLRFNGHEHGTILPGALLVSDAVELPAPSLSSLVVSLHLPAPTPVTTFHWDGRQTAWIVPGDQTRAAAPPGDGPGASRAGRPTVTTARLLLSGVQVQAPAQGSAGARAVVTLGDSITDGAAARLNGQARWPDVLAARLAPRGVAVVNAGISGARLLSDGMGVNALARLDRDVIAQPGAVAVVVLLGINDIALPGRASPRRESRPSVDDLIAGYRQLIAQLQAQGLRVIGGTLLPFEGALAGTPRAGFHTPEKDALRRQVNDWIRHGGAFDAVIDFDAVLRDPARPERLAARFDSGDHLHPGDEGLRAMGEAVDLDLLLPPDPAAVSPRPARARP